MKYIVVREYSKATAIKTLWQPLTRPLFERQEADRWKEFFEDIENKKPRGRRRNIFLVRI